MNNCNLLLWNCQIYSCEIVKLTESDCSKSDPLQVEMSTIALLKNFLYLTLKHHIVF